MAPTASPEMNHSRINHWLASAVFGLVSTGIAFAQDAAAPIRRSSPTPTPEATATPQPAETPAARASATPQPTATATPQLTATPSPTTSAAPEETPADRPTPATEQARPEGPTAKPVSERDEAPARAATPSRRVLQEKPVRAIEPRPASAPRRTEDDRADDPPPRRSNARERAGSRPALPPASRPTFDLSDSGSGYIGATVRALESRLQNAFKNHDLETIDELIADDFVGTSTSGRLGSKSTLLNEVRRDKNKYTSATARRMVVRTQGERTAVVTGISKETGTTPDGRRFSNSRRFTDTWVERQGRWQCIASAVTQLSD